MTFDQLFRQWVEGITSNYSPDKHIKAYYFGIFQSPSSYALYLIGTSTYDLDDDDWASNLEEFYLKDSYLELPAAGYDHLTWEAMLALVVGTITEFCKSDIFQQSFLGRAEVIATGFDAGDLIILKK